MPLIFIPLLAPEVLFIAIPSLLSNLLSNRFAMHTVFYQYTATITPILFISTIRSLNKIRQLFGMIITILLTIIILVFSIYSSFKGPLSKRPFPIVHGFTTTQSNETKLVLNMIPCNSSVSAQASIVPHLTHRKYIYTFPNPFYQVAWGNSPKSLIEEQGYGYSFPTPKELNKEIGMHNIKYIILSRSGTIFPLFKKNYIFIVSNILLNKLYSIKYVNDNTILLQRNGDYNHGLKVFSFFMGYKVTHNYKSIKNALQSYFHMRNK